MRSISDSETPDSQLLERYVQSSDGQAFARLFGKYRRLVFVASKAVLGNDQSAEDAVGATFLLLSRNAKRLTGRASIAGWLYDTASLTARNLKRMEEAQMRKLKRIGEELRIAEARTGADELDIEELLKALPADGRKALLLRFFQGFTYAEIGEALNCSEDAARQRVQRGLDRLSEMFAASGSFVTAEGIEQALSATPAFMGPSQPWLTKQSAVVADQIEKIARVVRVKIAAGGAFGVVLLAASPALWRTGSAYSAASVSNATGPRLASQAKLPYPETGLSAALLNTPFTLVYDEIQRSKGLPDDHNRFTISYNGKTLLTEKMGSFKVVGLFEGDGARLFLPGVQIPGLPHDLAEIPVTMESDFKSIDPDKEQWLAEATKTQAPPLTRFPAITNIPPVGVSLPHPLLRITLDGSYSWFMGGGIKTERDANGNLLKFGAFDTTYDLSDYRLVGQVPVAGRVTVRRSSGDWGGPNEYTLRSATSRALPDSTFQAAGYVGKLIVEQKGGEPYFNTNRFFGPKNLSSRLLERLKQFINQNLSANP